jgi:hypothetical protein
MPVGNRVSNLGVTSTCAQDLHTFPARDFMVVQFFKEEPSNDHSSAAFIRKTVFFNKKKCIDSTP